MSATEQDIKTNVTGTPYRILVFDANGLPIGYADFVRDENGNIGIGTNAPLEKLHLNGKCFVSTAIGVGILPFNSGLRLSDTYPIYFGYANNQISNSGGSLFINAWDNLLLGTNGGYGFYMDSSQKISLGAGFPTSKLDLTGNTSSVNQFRLREGVAFIGSHLSGDVVHDIDKTFKIVTARGVKESILTSLWKQFVTKNTVIANVETSILSTSSVQFEGDRNISANHYSLGKTFDFNVIGTYTLLDDPITATFFIYIGATKIRTITLPALGLVSLLRWELNFKTIQTSATTKQTLGTLIINTDDTNVIRVALPINSTTGFPTGLFDLKAVSDLATNSFLPSVNYATLKIE